MTYVKDAGELLPLLGNNQLSDTEVSPETGNNYTRKFVRAL